MRVLCATVEAAAPAARRRGGDGERGGYEGRKETRGRGEAADEELGMGLQQVARGPEAPQDSEEVLLHCCVGDARLRGVRLG